MVQVFHEKPGLLLEGLLNRERRENPSPSAGCVPISCESGCFADRAALAPFKGIDHLIDGAERTAHASLPHVFQPFGNRAIHHRLRGERDLAPLHLRLQEITDGDADLLPNALWDDNLEFILDGNDGHGSWIVELFTYTLTGLHEVSRAAHVPCAHRSTPVEVYRIYGLALR